MSILRPFRRAALDLGGRLRKNRFLDAVETHLKRAQTTLVIDVGANTGQYALQLRTLGYDGDIVSFEPVAATFAKLSMAAAPDPRWHVRQLALGGKDGSQRMHILPRSDFNSFHRPNDFALSNIERIAPEGVEEVVVRRLEGVLNELGKRFDTSSIFLKTDTQGHDIEVLRGGVGSLDAVTGLQAEVPVNALYEGVPPLNDTLAFYGEIGFQAVGFRPISWADGRLLEMDALFEKAAPGEQADALMGGSQ